MSTKRLFFAISALLSASYGFFSFAASPEAPLNDSPNYSIDYRIKVTRENFLKPSVTMELRGADEVLSVTSLLPDKRYLRFRGDGVVTQIASDVVWRPQGLRSSLMYDVVVPHERRSGVYDSYGKTDWVITRTGDLIPRKRILFRDAAKSYTTVSFDLPEDWRVITAMPRSGPAQFSAVSEDDKRYDNPTGWLIYGKVKKSVVTFKDVNITIAYPERFVRPSRSKDPAQAAKHKKYLDWFHGKIKQAEEIYGKVIPVMVAFMPRYSKEFLVILGKSPMWHGGLSGESSLYIHRGVPNIASDSSSTLVHEYFHVSAGFEKDPRDAEWFVEGLAEYFSMRLLFDAGIVSREDFQQGVDKHAAKGLWGANLTRTKNNAALYKNSTVVLFYLDELIRAKTENRKSLKDVIALLDDEGKPISTAMLRAKLEELYGASLSAEFAAYVTGGKKPDYRAFFK